MATEESRNHPLSSGLAEAAVEDGIRAYFAAARARVGPFVRHRFSLRGTMAMHRAALGWDVVRAPLNIALAGPELLRRLIVWLAGKAGLKAYVGPLARRSLLLRTAVSREMEWYVTVELLQLPCRQNGRVSTRDALAETIVADPRIASAVQEMLVVAGRIGREPAFEARLERAMAAYLESRVAMAELASQVAALGAGALLLKQLTPGAVTLGPALATVMVRQAAVSSFPLGAGLGGLWYGMFPVTAPVPLVAGLTGGITAFAAALAAFAGIITDPVQALLGLHRRRLLRLLDVLERQMRDPASPGYVTRAHYVARLLDLFSLLNAASRLAR